jgi:hypothetical protein
VTDGQSDRPVNTAADAPDSVVALRDLLVEALVRLPLAKSLTDRRLLISLIRGDVSSFPDVQEHTEARLHVVALVMTCLEHPRSLRALSNALRVMAPEDQSTRRVDHLVDSASLARILPEADLRRARDLVNRVPRPSDGWGGLSRRFGVDGGPARVFDHLAGSEPCLTGRPAALLMVHHLAQSTHDPLRRDLHDWVTAQLERLGIRDDRGDWHQEEASGGDPVEEQIPDNDDTPLGDEDTQNPWDIIYGDEPDAPVPDSSDHGELDEAGEESGDGMAIVAGRRIDKLPQVWGDVPQRNPHFIGRHILLAQMHDQLKDSQTTAVLPQALHGMGGVGKSQMAIEYVHRHRAEYDLVWWIPSEQTSQILSSLTKLALRLGLDVSPEANNAVPAVHEALSTGGVEYGNWLLVFDNAESLTDVRSFFPTGGIGKILVTSRNPEWAGVARTIEVDVFTRVESKQFLTTRTPELSDEDADRLAEALGDLPLAIEQAAAWRAATGMPVDEYLTLLGQKRMELLDESPPYQKSVAAAWSVSLDKLESDNLAALQLLQVCSFFSPDPISRELFSGPPASPVAQPLDETLHDPIRLARAIRDIQRYALARFDHRNNTLQMHRLVQAVLVGRMTDEQQVTMRRGAHALLASFNPRNPGRRTRWDRYQSLLPHVNASKAVTSDDDKVQDLVFNLVEFLYYWGDHEGCREFAEEAYENRLRLFGEEHQLTLRLAKYLGYIRFVVGDYAAATELFRRTWTLYQQTVGDDDEGALDAKLLVGLAFRLEGDFHQSLTLDRETFASCLRQFGPDDPVTLRAAHNLGVSLRLTGAFAEAKERDEETFIRRRELFGSDDFDTLNALNAYNLDLRESGDYSLAGVRQEDAYKQAVAQVGPENPNSMRLARNLAVARRRAGDHSGARVLSEETLERFRRRYGDDYPDTIATALNLAVDLRHAGDLEEAQRLGESSVARYEKLYPPDHPHTLGARINLAVVLRQRGDPRAASDLDQATGEALRVRLGADHPTLLACATNAASDLYALAEFEAALALDTDTLIRSERALGAEHPSTLAVGLNIALDLRALGRDQEADRLQADTVTRFRRALGDTHPATLNALRGSRADCDIDPMRL